MTSALPDLPPVEAVVFDFGGVFTTSPFAALMAAAAHQSASPLLRGPDPQRP